MTYSFQTNPKLTPLQHKKKDHHFFAPPKKGSTPTPLYHGLRHSEVLLSGTVERKSTRAWFWEQTRRNGFKQQCGGGTSVHGNLRVPLKSKGFYTTSHKGRCSKCWIIKTAGWASLFLGGKKSVQNAHIGSPIGVIPTLSQNKSWYLGKFYLHLTSVHHGLVRMTFIQLEAKLYQRQLTSSQQTSRFHAPFNWKNGFLPHHLQATAKKGLVDIFPFGVTAVAALDKLKPSTFADGSMLGEVESPWKDGEKCVSSAKTGDWWKLQWYTWESYRSAGFPFASSLVSRLIK